MKRKKSIVGNVVLLMSLVLLLMLASEAFFLSRYHRALEEKASASLEALSRQAGTCVVYELDSINTSAISSFRNARLTDLLTGRSDRRQDGTMALEELIGLNRSVQGAYLLDRQFDIVCSACRDTADEAAAQTLYTELSAAPPEISYASSPAHSVRTAACQDGNIYFSYLQPVLYRDNFDLQPPDRDQDAAHIGYILLVCKLISVEGITDYKLTVGGPGGITVASSESGLSDEELSEKYISKTVVLENGWSVTSVTAKITLLREAYLLTALVGLLQFFVTIAAIGLAMAYLTRNLARPIKRMQEELLITGEDPSHRLEAFPENEIGQVGSSINHMLDTLDRTRDEAMQAQQEKYESEILLRRAELNYIQAQVNPHFLYNSLESICGMAAMNRCDLVIETCTALSALFRYSIKKNDTVPLSEELRYAENYFCVMNRRSQGELELCIHVSPENSRVHVPKMILQPLLENALKHGRLRSLEKAQVSISARREAGFFVLSVSDNGCGMAPEQLEELRQHIYGSGSREDGQRLGLRNLHSRLHIHYGGDSRLEIESAAGQGTQLRLLMELPEDSL